MNRHDILAVALRLFSIFLCVLVVPVGVGLLPFILGKDSTYFVLLVIALLFQIGTAIVLWLCSLRLARWLLPSGGREQITDSLKAGQLFEIGVSLIGLWFVAGAVPDVCYFVALAFKSENLASIWGAVNSERFAELVLVLAEFFVGFWLLFMPNSITRHVQFATSPSKKP